MKSIIVVFAFVNNVLGLVNKEDVNTDCLVNNFEK